MLQIVPIDDKVITHLRIIFTDKLRRKISFFDKTFQAMKV